MKYVIIALFISIMGAFSGCLNSTPKTIEEECTELWFGRGCTLAPIQTWYQVNKDNVCQGYLFRTDRVPPIVKGKVGEIGIWVGVNNQRIIQGVKLDAHKETSRFFDRIHAGFYNGFVGIDPTKDKLPPPITSATLSSNAMRKDIASATQTIFNTMKQQ